MPVSTGIPGSWKLPLFWATVDGSKAGNLTQALPALLVGQMFTTGGAAGTATPNVPLPVGSVALAGGLFGVGSMLYRMVESFFSSNVTQDLWCLPIADPSAGVVASGSVAFAGTAVTGSGVFTLYIGGQKVQITVASTDTGQSIATNLVAAINALPEMPVTAAVDGTVNTKVDLTARWKGLTSNDIGLVVNYLGVNGGEVTPPGVTAAITAMASGAGTPDFTAAIAAIQTLEFDFVALPYTDTASLSTWATEYGFSSGGRWSYLRQQYGMIFSAYRNDYADTLTWGLTQNAPIISVLAIEQDSPSPVWEWAAAYCALGALGFTDDPARPLQTLEFINILPARLQNRYSKTQINNLTNSGLAVQAVAPDGNPMIMREATQYQFNSFGQADTAFGLLTVLATLQLLLRRLSSSITSKYPRVKLLPDGTKIGPGQAAVTPTDIKAELVAEYALAEYDGLASNAAGFAANLIVEISTTDPNVLHVLWPPTLAGQLRQFDVLAQFRLLAQPEALSQ